jgi:ABC-type branched-subunit amino acid transport system substrate-binding protein
MVSRKMRVLAGVALAAVACFAAAATALGNTTARAAKAGPVHIWVQDDTGVGGFDPSESTYPGAVAAAGVLNAKGGLDGHKLVIMRCQDSFNENLAAECAQKAVADKLAIGVSANDQFGAVIDPIFLQAGLADVGNDFLSAPDAALKNMFPIDPTAAGAAGAMVPLYKSGVHPLAIVAAGSGPATVQFIGLSNTLLQIGTGASLAGQIQPPVTATDLSTYAAQATQFAGAWLAMVDTQSVAFVRAYEAAGGKPGNLVCIATACDPNFIAALGSAAEGIHLGLTAVPVTANTPAVKAFVTAMKKYQPKGVLNNATEQGWTAMHMVADALKNAKTVSKASLLKGMSHLNHADVGGLYPPYTTTVPFTGLGGAEPHLYNTDYVYGVIKNGKQQCDGPCKFRNPFVAGQ